MIQSGCLTCGCAPMSCDTCKTPEACCGSAACCCEPGHRSWRRLRIWEAIRVEYISSGWMAVEAAGSILAGVAAGSFALIAFGGDSLVELISGIAVLLHMRGELRGSEASSELTERITTTLLFVLVPVIALGAVLSYETGLRPEGSPYGIAVAVGALAIMPYLYFRKRRLGLEMGSRSLSDDAVESLTCLLMSGALLAGLAVELLFRVWWVDYATTAVILAFVAWEALGSYRELRRGQPAIP